MKDGVVGKLTWKCCKKCRHYQPEGCEPIKQHGSGIIYAEVKAGTVVCLVYEEVKP